MTARSSGGSTTVRLVATPFVSAWFDLAMDRHAKAWLDEHAQTTQLFIAYLSSRACCSGVRVCDVRIRIDAKPSHRRSDVFWSPLGEVEGREVYMDSRLIERMPRQLPLTARGIGRFRHLDLDLSAEQWAEVLYPV
jgi:hypothetical protein